MGNFFCCKPTWPCKNSPEVDDCCERTTGKHDGKVHEEITVRVALGEAAFSNDSVGKVSRAAAVQKDDVQKQEDTAAFVICRVPKYVVAGGSRDGMARLWDLEQSTQVIGLKGHSKTVNCMAVEWEGVRVLTGSSDHSLRVWDRSSGACMQDLTGHHGPVTCVSVNWGLARALSGSSDCQLHLWDLGTGDCLQEIEGHSGSISCLDVDWATPQALSGSYDSTLRVWKLSARSCRQVFKVLSDCVQCVAVDWVGGHALSASFNTLRLWDFRMGKSLLDLRGHINTVTAVKANWERRRAVSGSTDWSLRVWNLETGVALHELSGHTGSVATLDVMWSTQQCLSAGRDGTLRLWDLNLGETVETFSISGASLKSPILCLSADWSNLCTVLRRVDSV